MRQPGPISAARFETALGSYRARPTAAVRTPIAAAEAANAIEGALRTVTGKAPNGQTVALLTAQWAHETGCGASMYNYNFGGLKGEGPGGQSVVQRTREGWGSSERTIMDRFRAYDSPEQGALDYVRLLASRYAPALEAAQRGDTSQFVRGLKSGGYFTGNADAYERSVASIASRLLRGENPGQSPVSRTVGTASEQQAVASALGSADWSSPLRSSPRVLPLVPEALLNGAPGQSGTSLSWDQEALGLDAVRALSMADEVARAALEIAAKSAGLRGDQGSSERTL